MVCFCSRFLQNEITMFHHFYACPRVCRSQIHRCQELLALCIVRLRIFNRQSHFQAQKQSVLTVDFYRMRLQCSTTFMLVPGICRSQIHGCRELLALCIVRLGIFNRQSHFQAKKWSVFFSGFLQNEITMFHHFYACPRGLQVIDTSLSRVISIVHCSIA